jgi:hypothetical protein
MAEAVAIGGIITRPAFRGNGGGETAAAYNCGSRLAL